jgi:hypothetical protein
VKNADNLKMGLFWYIEKQNFFKFLDRPRTQAREVFVFQPLGRPHRGHREKLYESFLYGNDKSRRDISLSAPLA